jgi:hypothetical protein
VKAPAVYVVHTVDDLMHPAMYVGVFVRGVSHVSRDWVLVKTRNWVLVKTRDCKLKAQVNIIIIYSYLDRVA